MKSFKHPINKYLCLTAVVTETNYAANTIYPILEDFKAKHFIEHTEQTPVILHRFDIVSKIGPFECLNNHSLCEQFNQDLLLLLKFFEYKIICVVIDKEKYHKKYHYTYDTYYYCMWTLMERFHLSLLALNRLNKNNNTGDILFVSRNQSLDKRLTDSYFRAYNKGTKNIDAKEYALTMSSRELKIKKKSANIAGLQLADIIAPAARRYVLDYFEIEKITTPVFNDQIIMILLDGKFRTYNGRINGLGIKLIP